MHNVNVEVFTSAVNTGVPESRIAFAIRTPWSVDDTLSLPLITKYSKMHNVNVEVFTSANPGVPPVAFAIRTPWSVDTLSLPLITKY